jgi:hypothetical protein
VDPTERAEGKGGELQDSLLKMEEGVKGKQGANFFPRDFRDGNTDFPLSELIVFECRALKIALPCVNLIRVRVRDLALSSG